MRSIVQPNDLAAALTALSTPRLTSYRQFFSARTEAEQYGLHQWNEAISMLFFKVLSLTEIATRNQFHKVLSAEYSNGGSVSSCDWYARLRLSERSTESVKKITHFRRRGVWTPKIPAPSPDDVVSKLTGGFWPHILDVTRDVQNVPVDWVSLIPQVFEGHRQKDATYWGVQLHQDQLFARLDFCNNLRNRVAHHEPLWKAGPLLEERRNRPGQPQVRATASAPSNEKEALERLALSYQRVQELLGWLSPALLSVHRQTETHITLSSLLTERGTKLYRFAERPVALDLSRHRKLRSLKRHLLQLHRAGLLVDFRRGEVSMGHWLASLP